MDLLEVDAQRDAVVPVPVASVEAGLVPSPTALPVGKTTPPRSAKPGQYIISAASLKS